MARIRREPGSNLNILHHVPRDCEIVQRIGARLEHIKEIQNMLPFDLAANTQSIWRGWPCIVDHVHTYPDNDYPILSEKV